MSRKRAQVTDENAQATLDAGGILAFIGEEWADDSAVEVREVSIDVIDPNPFQPRGSFDPEKLEELATSIGEHGFYGHLVVRQVGRRYQLAYGERRLRAAQIAGLTTLPIQVRELNDEQMLEISLTENIQREDLHPLDEARAYARLQEELGYSVREIAAKVGKGKSYVATLLSLLRYPDVEQAVRSAAIPVRTAEELAKIKNPDERRRLTNQVIAGNLDRQGLIDARQQKTRARQPAQVADTPVHTSEKPARSAPSLRAEGEAEPIQVPDERHPPTDQNITGDPDRQSPMALHEPRTKTDTPVRTADTPPVIQVFNHAFQVLETQTAAQIPPEAHQAVATILKQIIERATTLLEELQIRAI